MRAHVGATPYNQFVRRQLPVILVALAALLAPLPPEAVERYYSRGLFPRLQPVITTLSNRTSVAWFDVLLVGVVAWTVVLAVRDLRRLRTSRALLRIALRTATTVAAAYLAFLLLWGLNYRREPFARRVAVDVSRVTVVNAEALARETVQRLNALYAAAHADGWPPLSQADPRLADAFSKTLVRLGLPAFVLPARPKQTLLDLYFRRVAVAGMTDPFFLETLIASDTLPFERSHVVAHEWAHLAGITDEGEANFVGWLTCVTGSTSNQYSGWLFLYSEVFDALPADTSRAVQDALGSGPREDLRAIRARYLRQVSPRLSGAGWQVYDSYLKANRVDAGTASYAEVVRLILETGLR